VGEDVGKSIPGNLDYLRDDTEAKRFASLIPFWNANRPCDKRKHLLQIVYSITLNNRNQVDSD
jgi:hypothetical protein